MATMTGSIDIPTTTGRLRAPDGTELAYHWVGTATAMPLVCFPGGPGRASSYLGDLGSLGVRRPFVRLDSRGTGDSAVPADPTTYRMDRLVDDVEALRAHLGLETVDLLGHSGGANVAVLYAARYPGRLSHLVLATGGHRALGIPPIGFEEAVAARADEPWFDDAIAAQKALDEVETDEEAKPLLARMAPLFYGRWDDAAKQHAAADAGQRSQAAADGFYDGLELDSDQVKAAVGRLTAPVLVLAGQLDLSPTPAAAQAIAAAFPHATAATLAGAGHYPWLDDPVGFIEVVDTFLAGPPR
jgi:pimeloyl-ACP methyl ester carboxylesterase